MIAHPTAPRTALLLILWLGFAPLALAQDEQAIERAKIHYRAGEAFYQRGMYKEALGEFSASYHAAAAPALLHNIALCHERLGQIDQAIDYYTRFAETLPFNEMRKTIQGKIADLSKLRPAPAPKPQPTPRATPSPKEPRTLPAPASEKPAPASEKPARASRHTFRWPVGWAALSVGVGALAAGLGLGIAARGEADTYAEEVARGATYDELMAVEDRGFMQERAGITLMAIGGVLAGTGAGLLVWEALGTRSSEQPRASIAPILDGRGLGLNASVRF